MIEYSKVNVKLSDSQIKKLKDAVKDNTRTTLRIITHNKTKNKSKKCCQ